MTSSELIKIIREQTGLPEIKIRSVLSNFQNTVSQELRAGREIQIPDFGNFGVASLPERAMLNPNDRTQKIISPAQNITRFRPHENLTAAIQGKPTSNIVVNENIYIPYIDLSATSVPKKILNLIPEHIARHYQIVPIGEEKNSDLIVAMIDPEDREAIEIVKKKTGKNLSRRICTKSDLTHVLDQYSGISGELKEIVDSVGEDEIVSKPKDKKEQAKREEELTESAPAAKIVQSLVKRAVREGASDIHVEPTEEEVIARFRIDGILRKIITAPIEILPAIVSRIKILSGMKIDETRLPQDGRFQISLDQNEIDFRVSTFPTVNGEKVVMRILDKSSNILTLEQIGLKGNAAKIVETNIRKSHGMILVTGPTGSGKTTTLYAVLQKLMSESVNIVTLEDPVEYRIPSINQGQVHSAIGFTFADGLRSILRQDPDVIMIGEIRDYETADMAVHSALTGHIVLSTLHTNDAAGAVPRLVDMKIEPFLINSSVNAVIAQRLCRKICEKCREPFQPDTASVSEAQKEIQSLPANEVKPAQIQFFHGKGCDACSNTGYKGRVGIFEVFELSNDLKELVAKRASGTTLGEQAIKNGMVTIRQDGVMKAIEGTTTLEEVWRVTKE